MKAERRHELKDNSLAKGLENLPVLISIHLNKILLGLIFVALIVLLIQYRINSGRQARAQAMASMADVRAGVQNAMQLSFGVGVPQEVATNRNRVMTEVDTLISTIIADTSDPADSPLRAEAILARGDLAWYLANSVALPGAATQQSLELRRKPEELLDQAQKSYQTVIDTYPDQVVPHASALFGQAVIAETRLDIAAARAKYQAVLDDPELAALYGPVAKERINKLEFLKGRVLLGSFGEAAVPTVPTPLIGPTTSDSQPFGALSLPSWVPPLTSTPSTSPSTMPSIPAPAPTTQATSQPVP